jgi:catechol 2,3-dioxygenase-like lactoylglutathione lyase family enzyme
VLRLGHLNLAVTDRARAAAFYRRWFGFDRVLAEYDDGTTFVTDPSGFELALHEAERAPARETHEGWHFGFLAASASTVTEMAAAMGDAGVTVEGLEESPSYVGFRCRDPDGYEIEVYFEPRR